MILFQSNIPRYIFCFDKKSIDHMVDALMLQGYAFNCGNVPSIFIIIDNFEEYALLKRENRKTYITISSNYSEAMIYIDIEIEDMKKTVKLYTINKRSKAFIEEVIKTKKIEVHFLINGEKDFIKVDTTEFALNEKLIRHLDYIYNLNINRRYPEKTISSPVEEASKCYAAAGGSNVLPCIIDMLEFMRAWEIKDEFSIYISKENNYLIYISGICKNHSLIRDYLCKNLDLKDGAETNASGIPFISYEEGRIYYLKSGS